MDSGISTDEAAALRASQKLAASDLPCIALTREGQFFPEFGGPDSISKLPLLDRHHAYGCTVAIQDRLRKLEEHVRVHHTIAWANSTALNSLILTSYPPMSELRSPLCSPTILDTLPLADVDHRIHHDHRLIGSYPGLCH